LKGNRWWLVDHYQLDLILAVGYRVRSLRGIQFRQWATERLSEYLGEPALRSETHSDVWRHA